MTRRRLVRQAAAAAYAAAAVAGRQADSKPVAAAPAAPPGGVALTVDGGTSWPISPFIYGVNFYEHAPSTVFPTWPRNLRFSRVGGNRLSAYNWENNASNAGSDFRFANDAYLGGGDKPGEAVRERAAAAIAKGAAVLVTVPMLGWVARDKRGPVGAAAAARDERLRTRFVRSVSRKGAPFAATPSLADDVVYQDEFVAWLAGRFPGAMSDARTPLFFSLDNEPDLWGSTHEEVRSRVNGEPALLAYDELIDSSVAYARAIKRAAPGALVFGPAVATWAGAATLGRYPTPDPHHGRRFFLDVYLERMRQAGRAGGTRLLDVLDIHWYPEVRVGGRRIVDDAAPQTDAMVEARLQAPRSLWDPAYAERSWVRDVQDGPIRLLPLLRETVARHYPGTRIAITEYYYGRGGDITGGIAQADVLGIFGREGVFAASLWPAARTTAYGGGEQPERAYAFALGAFRMFRDYDGALGSFGDVGLRASTSDSAATSVYASRHAGDPSRIVVVAINKTTAAVPALITLRNLPGTYRGAAVYTLTAASPSPVRGADVAADPARPGTLHYTMPARSVTTLVLRPAVAGAARGSS